MSKQHKITAYILAIILFVVSSLLYLAADSKGFPDGHLTELDRAERPLFNVSSVIGLLAGLFLLYWALFIKATNGNTIFYRILLFVLIAGLIIGGLEYWFIETLDDGRGG